MPGPCYTFLESCRRADINSLPTVFEVFAMASRGQNKLAKGSAQPERDFLGSRMHSLPTHARFCRPYEVEAVQICWVQQTKGHITLF